MLLLQTFFKVMAGSTKGDPTRKVLLKFTLCWYKLVAHLRVCVINMIRQCCWSCLLCKCNVLMNDELSLWRDIEAKGGNGIAFTIKTLTR